MSEKEFKSKFGDDAWNKVVNNIVGQSECSSCGFLPSNPQKSLQIHIFDVDYESPEKTNSVLLCNACHAVCHIDKAVDYDWVKIVNSKFNQSQLIQMSRTNQLSFNINNRSIVELTKSPQEFLEDLVYGKMKDSKIKVLFKSNFPWGDI